MTQQEMQAVPYVRRITETYWRHVQDDLPTDSEIISLAKDDRFRIRFTIAGLVKPVYVDIIFQPANVREPTEEIVCDRGWHVIALDSDHCQCQHLKRIEGD